MVRIKSHSNRIAMICPSTIIEAELERTDDRDAGFICRCLSGFVRARSRAAFTLVELLASDTRYQKAGEPIVYDIARGTLERVVTPHPSGNGSRPPVAAASLHSGSPKGAQ